jgi:hypothetical protein
MVSKRWSESGYKQLDYHPSSQSLPTGKTYGEAAGAKDTPNPTYVSRHTLISSIRSVRQDTLLMQI